MTTKASDTTGKRVISQKMGLLGALSYFISNIVGSGIFIAPTSVLVEAKSPGLSLIIWASAAVISVLGSFCYVELGTSIRSSGADFAYLCYVRWYSVAFAFMCVGCILTYPATVAIQSQTFSEYVIKGFNIKINNEITGYFAKRLLGFSLIWLLMLLNFFSMKQFVSRFQIIASIAKVFAAAVVIFTGFFFLIVKGEKQNLSDPFKGSETRVGHIVLALYAGLFSYDGWDILNFGAEEIEKPRRTMPLAIFMGMLIVAVIYITTNIAYFVVLDVDKIRSSEAVASTFAAEKLGNFQYAIPFFVCAILIGSLNSTIFVGSRYLQVAAREGHLPTFISCINHKCGSPRVALFVNILLSMAISFAGDLDVLINYIGFTQWAQRLCTMTVFLWIRSMKIATHPDAIRTPLIIPIVFFLICLALCVITIVDSIHVSAAGLGVLIGGFLLYFLFVFEKSLPALTCYRKYSATLNQTTTALAQIIFNVMPERSVQTYEREIMENLRIRSAMEKKERCGNNATACARRNPPLFYKRKNKVTVTE